VKLPCGLFFSQKDRIRQGNKKMFEPKIRSSQTDMLMKAVLALDNEEDAYRFFEDLCTIPEIRSIAQRFEVAVLLRQGETYQKIAEQTGASSATISRVNRSLSYGADGYDRVLQRMAELRSQQES